MSNDRPGKGLGMGLSALLGDAPRSQSAEASAEGRGVREIDIARIRPNPNQPRVRFSEGLADTVAWYRENTWWWEPIRSGEYRSYYERQYGRSLHR